MDLWKYGLKIITENSKTFLFDKHTYSTICSLEEKDIEDIENIINTQRVNIENKRKIIDKEKIEHYNKLLLNQDFYFDLQWNIFYIKYVSGNKNSLISWN